LNDFPFRRIDNQEEIDNFQREEHEACTLQAFFKELALSCKASNANPFDKLKRLVEKGLRLQVMPDWRTAVVDFVKIRTATINASMAGRIDTEDATVLVDLGTPSEKRDIPLHQLYVIRSSAQRIFWDLGEELPWPDDEFSRHWIIAAEIDDVVKKRGEIQDTLAKDIDEERWKQRRLDELKREEKRLRELSDQADKAINVSERPVRSAQATKARIDQKAARQAALEAFIERIKRNLEAGNYNSEHQPVLVPNLPAYTTTESAAAQIKIDCEKQSS